MVSPQEPWTLAAKVGELQADVDKLRAENERLRAELSEFARLKEYAKSLGQETYLEINADRQRLRGALEAIADEPCTHWGKSGILLLQGMAVKALSESKRAP